MNRNPSDRCVNCGGYADPETVFGVEPVEA